MDGPIVFIVGRGPLQPIITFPFRRKTPRVSLRGARDCGSASRSAARSNRRKELLRDQLPSSGFRPQPPGSTKMSVPPPNAFSNELAQWIRDKCTPSIVFVEFRPREVAPVKFLWDKIAPISAEPDGVGPKNTERLESCRDIQCCTGSVVQKVEGGHLKILTCAHVLGPVFNSSKPITAKKVNELYDAFILCDHQEQRYQEVDQERIYMKARVVEMDCSKDLMLLHISAQAQKCCPRPHLPLRIARSFPKRLEKVVMLSWPISSDRTAVQGEISHPSRSIGALAERNIHGFKMKLSQVDITSERGSSGAPLLNGAGNYCGVLYGGTGFFSYYIFRLKILKTHCALGM